MNSSDGLFGKEEAVVFAGHFARRFGETLTHNPYRHYFGLEWIENISNWGLWNRGWLEEDETMLGELLEQTRDEDY